MTPTQTLKNEHRVIEQVLDCLEKMVERSEADGRLDGESAREALDFFRSFADRCHHGKEEHQLFPAMEERGFPSEQGPVAVMRTEHDQGRRLIAGMDAAIPGAAEGTAEGRSAFTRSARAYVDMLRSHILKEDECLFPMADQALDERAQAALRERFDQVERELGTEFHVKYVGLADALADRFGVAKERLSGEGHHGHGACSKPSCH